jgi:hypothetical protein
VLLVFVHQLCSIDSYVVVILLFMKLLSYKSYFIGINDMKGINSQAFIMYIVPLVINLLIDVLFSYMDLYFFMWIFGKTYRLPVYVEFIFCLQK